MSTIRILSNVGNAFFLASGCWGDLLLIRVFLTFAYVCLLAIHFVTRSTNYEDYVWGFGTLYLHGSSAVRLFHDEGEVKMDEKKEQVGIIHQHMLTVMHANYRSFATTLLLYSHHHFLHTCLCVKEALWRYFYRRSGISRLLFKSHVAKCFELIDAKAGEALDTSTFFYIILDGSVDIKTTVTGSTRDYTLVSGESFDIKHLQPLFRVRSAYMKKSQRMSPFVHQDIVATVAVDAKLFRCSHESMHGLCNTPATKDASQGLLIATLSDMAEREYMKYPPLPNDSVTKDMLDEENQLPKGIYATFKSTRSAVFAPLEDFEQPARFLAGSGSFKGIHNHILHTLKVAFLLPWPFMAWLPGLRQIGSLPVPPAASDVDEKTIPEERSRES